MNKKEFVLGHKKLVSLACGLHNLANRFCTKITGENNRIIAPCALLKKTNIRIKGSNNTLIIGDFTRAIGASIYINGNNNRIVIGDWGYLKETDLFIEDDGGSIVIGNAAKIIGKTYMAVIEGTSITIGDGCIFSHDVQFRTGDGHSILDMQGRRINESRDIVVGNHVWFGTKVYCTKGARIGSHCIVGTGALVTKDLAESYCTLAGVPAKIVKRGTDWSMRRIPVGEIAADFVPPVTEE